MQIRPAIREDAARIIEMTRQVSAQEGHKPPALTAETLERFAFADGLLKLFVATDNGALIGHIAATRSFDVQSAAATWWIADLFVEPAYRRRGVGRSLLAEVQRAAIADGAAYLQWLVAPNNAEAIAFYNSLGAKSDAGVAMFLQLRIHPASESQVQGR